MIADSANFTVVNTNLARGAITLPKKEAIVKRLDSVQNLGAMTVLCSGKVGYFNHRSHA